MTNKVTLNTSIAAVVDIDNVGEREKVEIYFTADENWNGTFVFNLWSSHLKTKEFVLIDNALVIVDNVMTLTIDADNNNLEANQYYYEIFSDNEERVFFKGLLKIIK